LLVIELGGGRRVASDSVDHRVGLTEVVGLGQRVEAGELLATVHAADNTHADLACARLAQLIVLGDAPTVVPAVLSQRIGL
jgi:thymidine phosphorylase